MQSFLHASLLLLIDDFMGQRALIYQAESILHKSLSVRYELRVPLGRQSHEHWQQVMVSICAWVVPAEWETAWCSLRKITFFFFRNSVKYIDFEDVVAFCGSSQLCCFAVWNFVVQLLLCLLLIVLVGLLSARAILVGKPLKPKGFISGSLTEEKGDWPKSAVSS